MAGLRHPHRRCLASTRQEYTDYQLQETCQHNVRRRIRRDAPTCSRTARSTQMSGCFAGLLQEGRSNGGLFDLS
jgi:hypothetical protein